MRKKILLLASRLPYPPISGAKLKNYNLIKILSKKYDIFLVIITDEILDKKSVEFLNMYTKHYKFFRKNKINFIYSSSKTLFNRLPLQVNYYYFRDVQKYVNEVASEVDIVISTLVRTTEYLQNIDKVKIFDMADSIAQNYTKSLANVKSLFWKNIYKFEAHRLLSYEQKMIDKFDVTFMFNKEEISFFNSIKIKWLPHGTNEKLFEYGKVDNKYKNCICFFGKMDYQPNIDAVLWFVEHVLNKLNKNITFMIIGANPKKEILELEQKYSNIKVTGFVEDPYIILKSSLCTVASMQTGGGIQNKVLESMALGTINIISSLASKPIGGIDGEHYFVRDNPSDIADLVNDIFMNKNKFKFIEQNAKNYIKNNFTWEKFGKVYINEIERLLNDSKN